MSAVHKCFVCKPSSSSRATALHEGHKDEMKKIFSGKSVRDCDHYDRSKRNEFIMECPKNSKGCLTKLQGKLKMCKVFRSF